MNAGTEVVVARTGVANLAAVVAALRRAGARPVLSDRAGDVRDAGAVVLPGVGSFAAGMRALVDTGLDLALRDRVRDGRPTLAICLGMQLLGLASAESPGVEGVGAVDARYARFAGEIRVPQIGWNAVVAPPEARILANGDAYFANSFRLDRAPDGWTAAWSGHGGSFVAALERGAVVACQFHPELSGAFGAGIVERWIAAARREVCAC
ncbi:MAG: imidazole glycerol phosphate synthase subunit HisH [Planctomycetota bacterium]|nr:imidazole glycerol phosphate synthase subunit HisH [Planctomycetota bacterium]